jgi:catechol 2,3-dioxygenase-like lactoylglutathione lyase family enzyme
MDTQDRPALQGSLPVRLHHRAIVTRDQEANRHFLEDILGIPLVATWCERTFYPALQREIVMCHTFYAMADGGALAFFQFADPEMLRLTTAEKPAEVPQFDHTAFSVDDGTYDEIAARLRRAGLEFRETDHGYCRSLYVYSPDGLRLEFTVDHPKVEEIMAERRGSAHADLARWLAGDHSVNNDLRHH